MTGALLRAWAPGAVVIVLIATFASAQVDNYEPVTTETLLNPSPDDWLMFSRTYDAQRFSTLDQIDSGNVDGLRMVWSRGLGAGASESIPIVRQGVLYTVHPGAIVQALDATNGNLIWQYERELENPAAASTARTKNLAIYEDLVFYTAPDSYVVALDVRSGRVRWETLAGGGTHTSGPIVVEGKVITGRGCSTRADCFIAAHDAETGEEVWRFHTTQAPGEGGDDSWGNVPVEDRVASTWGLPGSYDPERRLIYWGIANPTPYTRMERHGGNPDEIARTAPADLYSNSTVALDPDTGELVWYYQHNPGEDWDLDYTNERTLVRTRFDPDPEAVKWINPNIPRGEERSIAVSVGEPGGLWALDAVTGEFLWATPFPFDVPEFHIADIDVETGNSYPNFDLGFREPGERHLVCFHNTRSYWATAYHPGTNSLYVPYLDNCLDMTAAGPDGPERRLSVPRPGADVDEIAGLAKVNMTTGRIELIYSGPAPSNGAVLATAGNLVFWGDLDRRFRAFDAETGSILWESILGGSIQNSTITYAVNGRQYVAVMTGEGLLTGRLIDQAGLEPSRGHNSIYVFALPE